jgi:hypothetical protein
MLREQKFSRFQLKVLIMRFSLTLSVITTISLSVVPVLVRANSTLSRADVREQLVQLKDAGYNPQGDESNYPADIQAAQARVATADGSATDVGGSIDGSVTSGNAKAKQKPVAAQSKKVPTPTDSNQNDGVRAVYFGS